MKTLLRALVVAVVFGVLLAPQFALAQSAGDPNTRSLQGVVTDSGGKPVQGAAVQLKDTKTLQIRSFITATDGAYHFSGLSTNVDYEVSARHDSAQSSTKTLSNFDTHKTATINLKLK